MGQRGKLIVFEGIDGSGKTTNALLLQKWLRSKKHDVVVTRVSNRYPIGRLIKNINRRGIKIPLHTRFLLYATDFSFRLHCEIRPTLDRGSIVIADRYSFSSYVYNIAQGIDINWTKSTLSFLPKPDCVFILDVPPEIGMSRIKQRRKPTVYENDMETQRKMRRFFIRLANSYESCYIVDASREIHTVQKNVRKIVGTHI